MIGIGMIKRNQLDASSSKETAFRTQLITADLMTKDKLHVRYPDEYKDSKCESCMSNNETEAHFIKCTIGKHKNKDTVRLKLIDKLKTRRKESTDWTQVKEFPTTSELLQLLKFDDYNFHKSNLARGVITETDIARAKQLIEIDTQPVTMLKYVTDCWLSILYEEGWKPRATKIAEKIKELNEQREKQARIEQIQERARQRLEYRQRQLDEKNNRNKRKRIEEIKKELKRLKKPRTLFIPSGIWERNTHAPPELSQHESSQQPMSKRTTEQRSPQKDHPKSKKKKSEEKGTK